MLLLEIKEGKWNIKRSKNDNDVSTLIANLAKIALKAAETYKD